MRRTLLVGALLAGSSPASLAASAGAQFDCATIIVSGQHVAPDSSGSGVICTVEFCLQPPVGYELQGTFLEAGPVESGADAVGIMSPNGWQGEYSPFGGYWTGPHISETVCGFGLMVHLPAPMSGYHVGWAFLLAYDIACGDSFQVDCLPMRVAPSTWGRLKAVFR